MGSKPRNCPWEILRPARPQHKHRDSPLSHSTSAMILAQKPPISDWISTTSIAHWAVAYWTSSTHCSMIAILELLPWILSWLACSCTRFALMEVVIVYASLIHGCRHAFKTTSLCQAASTCSLSAFAYCIHTSPCVRETVCKVPFTSTYFCCNSCASISHMPLFLGAPHWVLL